eukprot:863261-Pyramimonas_sp.AAC.1
MVWQRISGYCPERDGGGRLLGGGVGIKLMHLSLLPRFAIESPPSRRISVVDVLTARVIEGPAT